MVRDVYGTDDGPIDFGPRHTPIGRTRITVLADAEPDALVRILGLLLVLNQTPERCNQVRRHDGLISVTIELQDCTESAADLVCRKISQLTCVTDAQWARVTLPRE